MRRSGPQPLRRQRGRAGGVRQLADFGRDDRAERRDVTADLHDHGDIGSDRDRRDANGLDTRVDIICDPNLSRGDRSPTRAFATECVAPPSAATNRIGTARGDEIIGPGYLNWDITIAKNIPFGGNRRVQFRTELYNAFNNVQFATVNTAAIFNAAGQQTNAEFGQYTAARDARRIQLTIRVDF